MSDYNDDDLVYIDTENKKVIGPVEWEKDGSVKRKEKVEVVEHHDEEVEGEKEKGKGKGRPRRSKRKSYYPWGSFRTAKKLYHVNGKFKEEEVVRELNEAMELALKEPYWDTEPGKGVKKDAKEDPNKDQY